MDSGSEVMRLTGEPAVDHAKAGIEARAQVMWGENPKEVLGYLTTHGYSSKEASELVDALTRDRAATIRGIGIRKIVVGSGLLAVLAMAILFMCYVRHALVELVAIPGAMGVYGLWKVVEGASMILSPRKHEGDLADEEE